MRLSASSLGFKLNLSLIFFVLLLASATAVFILLGFHRTQDNATQRSREGLEELGRTQVLTIASDQTDLGAFQLGWAADASQMAARYMVELRARGGSVPFDTSTLTRTPTGLIYDANPGRATDLAMPNFADLTPAALRDIADSAALDAVFPSILAGYPGQIRGLNFDPIGVSFSSVNQVTRYYPPIGIHDIAAPDTDVSPGLARVGPRVNPGRKTLWTVPYSDTAGQGLVITAYAPVYDGDTYVGMIGIDLSITRLVSTINEVQPTEFGFAFYIDSEGTLLPSDSFDRLDQELRAGNEELQAVMAAMRRGEEDVARVNVGGRDMFIGYSPLAGVGGSFAVAASVEELTAQAAAITASINEEGDRTLTFTLAAMGVIFLAGLAGETWLNRRLVLAPIQAIVDGTRRVARGDLDTSIPAAGDDELGMLATSFNAMTDEMRARRDALEREVRERTEAQEELRAVFAAMTDRVVVVDREGRYLRIAQTGGPRLFAENDQVGQKIEDVRPPEVAAVTLAAINEALDTGRTVITEFPMTTPNGTHWLSGVYSPMPGDAVVAVVRDITALVEARKEVERAVEERTRELNTVLEVSHRLVATLDLNTLLQVIMEQTETVCQYSRASLYLYDQGSIVLFGSRVPGGDLMTMPQSFRLAMDTPEAQAVWMLITGREPSIIADMHGDSPVAVSLRSAIGPGVFNSANREVSSWMGVPLLQQDRVVGLLSLTHTEADFFTPHHYELVSAIANQAAVAIENAKLYEQAQQLAAVEERQKLARELHDSVSQALYGIALGARTARTLLDRDPVKAVEPVDYVLQLAEAGLAEMRALIFELRPESLEIEGLVAAIEKQVAATSARYNIRVRSELGAEPEMTLQEKEVFYRIAQEALHNVVKHAKATEATVRLRSNGAVTLEVTDNGIGFDSGQAYPGHMGLVSMRERATHVGARVEVESQPGAGATVRLTLPGPNG